MGRLLLRYEPGMKKAVTRICWCGFQQGNIGWHLVGCSNGEENMTNTSSGSNSTWGAFTPVMPAFIRLIAGVIVLVIIEAVLFRVFRFGPKNIRYNHLICDHFLIFNSVFLALGCVYIRD